MRHVTCSQCHTGNVPQNASLQIDGAIHCEPCLAEKFPNQTDFKGHVVVHEADPTICFKCAQDNGEQELGKLGTHPICPTCHRNIEATVFPTWVKAFFIGILVVVVFSFAWNWRFIKAAHVFKEMSKGEATEADLTLLAENVPEIAEFVTLAEFYKGIRLLREDKPGEALIAFSHCDSLPEDYPLKTLRLQANMSAAYDLHNYDTFLRYTKEFLQYDSSSNSYARLASAYSCLYASSKTKAMSDSAWYYIIKARSFGDTTADFSNYVNMIEYRLASGTILDLNEFNKKYPNGWTKE